MAPSSQRMALDVSKGNPLANPHVSDQPQSNAADGHHSIEGDGKNASNVGNNNVETLSGDFVIVSPVTSPLMSAPFSIFSRGSSIPPTPVSVASDPPAGQSSSSSSNTDSEGEDEANEEEDDNEDDDDDDDDEDNDGEEDDDEGERKDDVVVTHDDLLNRHNPSLANSTSPPTPVTAIFDPQEGGSSGRYDARTVKDLAEDLSAAIHNIDLPRTDPSLTEQSRLIPDTTSGTNSVYEYEEVGKLNFRAERESYFRASSF